MRFALSLVSVVVPVFLIACQTSAPPTQPKAASSPVSSASAPASVPAAPAPVEAAKPVSSEMARNIANNCFTCHGPEGRSPGTMPSLTRLSADKIAARLREFRSGAETSTVMGRHAKAYTDAEIDAVAKYIASQNK